MKRARKIEREREKERGRERERERRRRRDDEKHAAKVIERVDISEQ